MGIYKPLKLIAIFSLWLPSLLVGTFVPVYALQAESHPAILDTLNTSGVDAEAELLAMEISGALLPPPSLYEQIRSDLSAIRQAHPAMTSIHHRPRWEPGELIVGLTAEAMDQFNHGQYHGLDALNAEYGPVEITTLASIALILQFEQRYNPEYLAPLYAAAQGVRYAEPNFLVGDGNKIEISGSYYTVI